MAREFSGLAKLAFASTALAIPGCGESAAPEPPAKAAVQPPQAPKADPAPLAVVSAAVDDHVLTLKFSKPVVVPATIDPSRFRLTFGYASKKNAGYSQYYYASTNVTRTWYSDVGRFSKETTKLRQPAPNAVEIPLPANFNPSFVCEDVARIEKRGDTEAGLYLHYSEEGGPAVTDLNGNRLASVAPYWKTNESSVIDGDFENEPLPVKLRCP